ncbi:hypothetical protein ABFS83_09G108700 [Erythranthe nasuta]
MENGKDVEKSTVDPLFPRLHINDADKGGQKAPPRNKMAVCEPYKGLNSNSMKMVSIRPSSGRGSVVSPDKWPEISHSVNRHHSRSTGLNLNTSLRDFEPRISDPPNHRKNQKSISVNSISTLQNEHSKEPRNEEGRAYALADLVISYPQLGCNKGTTKIESIKKCSKDMDYGFLKLAFADEKQEISDSASVADSASVLHITPNDVIGLFGERPFIEARNKILHHQRIFSMQLSELHRLIKVQRLIAESPELLHEKNFDITKPSSESSQTNNPLYTSPLDPSPHATKRKFETLNSDKNCGAESVMNKLPPPWFSHSPSNQWLVPAKSPSDGLIYKPIIVGPVFGNYVPSYLQQYTMPLIEPVSPNLKVEQTIPFIGSDKNASKLDANFDILGQSLPSIPTIKEQRDEQSVEVIKVVPHNPKSATESAGRILRSILEERNKT